jgi:hypothetical protein
MFMFLQLVVTTLYLQRTTLFRLSTHGGILMSKNWPRGPEIETQRGVRVCMLHSYPFCCNNIKCRILNFDWVLVKNATHMPIHFDLHMISQFFYCMYVFFSKSCFVLIVFLINGCSSFMTSLFHTYIDNM